MTTPRITATMLSTVLAAPSAVVVLDDAAGAVRLQTCLTREQADDPTPTVTPKPKERPRS